LALYVRCLYSLYYIRRPDIIKSMAKKKKRSKRQLEKKVKRFREHQKGKKRERDLAGRFEEDSLGDLETTKERIGSRKSRSDTRKEVIELTAARFEEFGVVAVSGEEDVESNGRVLEILGPVSRVEVGEDILECGLHMELRAIQSADKNFLVVGERICVRKTPEGETEGVIVAVFRRDSRLSRRSSRRSHIERVIAANVDQMCVVGSVAEPSLRPALIDRFLVAASVGNLEPVIVINKIDLVDEEGLALAREILSPYYVIKYPMLFVSALARRNLDGLRGVLAGKTTIFSGHSGVGKSALVNALDPRYKLETREVSEASGKGKHMTSRAKLLPLRFGGYVVDTPGIRSFSLWEVEKQDLALYYPEMKNLASECRYGGCTHTHEPGCAVKDAVDDGRVSYLRYDNYLKILESIEETPPA